MTSLAAPQVPFEFEVGAGKVIAGLERTVHGMRTGEARRVFVPSALAYGSAGAGAGVVPPYADLPELPFIALIML